MSNPLKLLKKAYFEKQDPRTHAVDTILVDSLKPRAPNQEMTVVIWLKIRNPQDIEKWVDSVYNPNSPWFLKRPTRSELQNHYGYSFNDPKLQSLITWLNTWGTVTAISPIGDFVILFTTVQQFNDTLKTVVQTDTVHEFAQPKPEIPANFKNLISSFSWLGYGLTPKIAKVEKTMTMPEFTIQQTQKDGQLKILNCIQGDNGTQYNQLINMYGGGANYTSTKSNTVHIGLVYAGDFVDGPALDQLQTTQFPNSNNGQPWTNTLGFLIANNDCTLSPFPQPYPQSMHSETDLDIQASFSSLSSLIDKSVTINVIELVTDAFASEEAGQVSFDVFKVLPLEAMLMIDTKGTLPMTWSNSYGTDQLDVKYLHRLEQEHGLLSLLGYTIVFSSGDQGLTYLDNKQVKFGSTQLFATTITGLKCPQHSKYVLDVGGVIHPLIKPDALVIMNPGIHTGDAGWFASGGGFSQFIDAATWQKEVVCDYLDHLDNSSLDDTCKIKRQLWPELGYNPCGRAVPDVVGPGFINMFITGTPDSQYSGGTSLAAPFTTGILAVAEWQRQQNGYPPGLGCINPLLYSEQGRKLMNRHIKGTNTNFSFPGFPNLGSKGQWDACRGLGIFDAKALIEWLAHPNLIKAENPEKPIKIEDESKTLSQKKS